MLCFRTLALVALAAVLLSAAVAEIRAEGLGDDPPMDRLLQNVVPSPTKLSFVCAAVCPTAPAAATRGYDLFEVVCPGGTSSQGSYDKLCGTGLRSDPEVQALEGTGEICRDASCAPQGDYEICRCDFGGCKKTILACTSSGCAPKGAEAGVATCTCNDQTQLACSGNDIECLVEVERRLGAGGVSTPGQCSAHATSLREDRTRTTVQCAYGMPECRRLVEDAGPARGPDGPGTPVEREP